MSTMCRPFFLRCSLCLFVVPTQGTMLMIEAGDTVLVLSQTLLGSDNKGESEYSMDRRATYVYRNVDGRWLCAIDNSYGTPLLD